MLEGSSRVSVGGGGLDGSVPITGSGSREQGSG